MNRIETQRILAFLCNAYPNTQHLQTDDAVEVWTRGLRDLTYTDASHAVSSWILSEKWCPTIAELKEAIVTNVAGSKDWGDAWNECMKIISRYGQYQEEEALEHMSPMTRQIVKRLGYRELCLSENQMQDRANFRQIYEQVTGNEYEKAALPQSLQDKIAQIGNSLLLE